MVGVVGVETAVPSAKMVGVVGVETALSTTGVPGDCCRSQGSPRL